MQMIGKPNCCAREFARDGDAGSTSLTIHKSASIMEVVSSFRTSIVIMYSVLFTVYDSREIIAE